MRRTALRWRHDRADHAGQVSPGHRARGPAGAVCRGVRALFPPGRSRWASHWLTRSGGGRRRGERGLRGHLDGPRLSGPSCNDEFLKVIPSHAASRRRSLGGAHCGRGMRQKGCPPDRRTRRLPTTRSSTRTLGPASATSSRNRSNGPACGPVRVAPRSPRSPASGGPFLLYQASRARWRTCTPHAGGRAL
jgi:hypothetical protein